MCFVWQKLGNMHSDFVEGATKIVRNFISNSKLAFWLRSLVRKLIWSIQILSLQSFFQCLPFTPHLPQSAPDCSPPCSSIATPDCVQVSYSEVSGYSLSSYARHDGLACVILTCLSVYSHYHIDHTRIIAYCVQACHVSGIQNVADKSQISIRHWKVTVWGRNLHFLSSRLNSSLDSVLYL